MTLDYESGVDLPQERLGVLEPGGHGSLSSHWVPG